MPSCSRCGMMKILNKHEIHVSDFRINFVNQRRLDNICKSYDLSPKNGLAFQWGGEKIMIADDLSNVETVEVLFHELLHILFPTLTEKEVKGLIK